MLLAISPAWSQKIKVFSIQKTACLGPCPVYTIDVYSNGKVILCADKFVSLGEGRFKAHLSKDKIAELRQQFEEADFLALPDEPHVLQPDLPTTIIYYNNGSKNNRIVLYGSKSDKLIHLDAALSSLLDSEKWRRKH